MLICSKTRSPLRKTREPSWFDYHAGVLAQVSPGWNSAYVIDAFGLLAGLAEQHYCGTGFDMRNPTSSARARIGSVVNPWKP